MFHPVQQNKKKITIGTLNVVVKQAKGLSQLDKKRLPNGFVMLYLLPDTTSGSRRKTAAAKSCLNPQWEEQFTYEKVVLEELATERVLEVTVWDLNKGASNDFIGGLRVGPIPGRKPRQRDFVDCTADEAVQWEAMLARPGEWVEQWHTLRLSMNPRRVDLSSLPSPAPLHTFTPVDFSKPPSEYVASAMPAPAREMREKKATTAAAGPGAAAAGAAGARRAEGKERARKERKEEVLGEERATVTEERTRKEEKKKGEDIEALFGAKVAVGQPEEERAEAGGSSSSEATPSSSRLSKAEEAVEAQGLILEEEVGFCFSDVI